MNVLIGVCFIALAIGGVCIFAAFLFDGDASDLAMGCGIAIIVGSAVLVVGAVGIWFIVAGPSQGPQVGSCYKAYPHTTTTIVPAGKVFVPLTYNGVDLYEIPCP